MATDNMKVTNKKKKKGIQQTDCIYQLAQVRLSIPLHSWYGILDHQLIESCEGQSLAQNIRIRILVKRDQIIMRSFICTEEVNRKIIILQKIFFLPFQYW